MVLKYASPFLFTRAMLRLGSSETWENSISVLTNGRINEFSAEPLLEYFKPLQSWLEKYNIDNNVTVGWNTQNLPIHF